MQNCRFSSKIALRLKKVCYKLQSFFVRKLSAAKLYCIHWPNYSCKNDWWGLPLVPEIVNQTDRVGAKSPIFARSDSAVTSSEKKFQLTLIRSPLRAFLSPPLKGGSKTQSVQN